MDVCIGSGEVALMENTDKSLIDAHCQGDKEAFAELVRRYGNSVLGYLMRMTGNREQAEDLFQETFRRVHERAHTLRGNQFKPWLFTIATRIAIDGLRRSSRLQVVSLNQKLAGNESETKQPQTVEVADDSYDPAQEAVRAEQVEQVRLAIQSLPTKQRAMLVLAYYQQLSYAEVAKAMGCTIGTVKTQMYRALKTLAKRLPDIEQGLE